MCSVRISSSLASSADVVAVAFAVVSEPDGPWPPSALSVNESLAAQMSFVRVAGVALVVTLATSSKTERASSVHARCTGSGKSGPMHIGL